MYAGNARPLRSARLSREIMLLSPKGMNVQNVITLPTPLSERDSALKKPWWQGSFRGFIIMSDGGFECLTNLAVRCPLPNPLPRGKGIRFLKIREP